MCTRCGCAGDEHAHPHAHPDSHAEPRILHLERNILARNDGFADRNRDWFAARGILALNLVSAPGAGKTTLLERTLRDLGGEIAIGVVEGDQATSRDAERIRAAGGRAVQINTGTGCHLEAEGLARFLRDLDPTPGSIVFIENVGNLVCPALFDLGERAKVLLASVPEGDDKPQKYPHMFAAADLVLLNKRDLLPHVPFDVARFRADVARVKPRLPILETDALHGDGLEAWYAWLREALGAATPREDARRP
jgi:hydrogenase nickel incorporation protein HypB